MFRIIVFFCILCASLNLWGQQNPFAAIATQDGAPDWYKTYDGTQLSTQEFLSQFPHLLGMSADDQLILFEQKYDELGFHHSYYQLFHQGYWVEHSLLAIHSRAGRVESFNYFLPPCGTLSPSVRINEKAAIAAAKVEIAAQEYLWEVAFFEEMIKDIKQNPEASFFPEPALMWVDTDFKWETPEYVLAYKMDVFTAQPHGSWQIYIDAKTGAFIKKLNTLHTMGSVGTAETRYSGTRTIITDSTATEFRLRDYSRAAGGIETYDLNNSTNLNNAVDFTDDDNYWNNVNPDWDEVATDVHWGTEMAYDYFFERYGRDGYDGQGTLIPSFVHYGPKSAQNAFWNVYYAAYSDVNGNPYVGSDVVGHEFTHGVIRNSLGNLIYIDESAAINEGYADIFGNCVQHFADSTQFSWEVGEDATAFRSMSNPNSLFGLGSIFPDTYKGSGWYTGELDNGGAHQNSTAFSHCFYLVAEGGTGTNDNGDNYQVTGVGIDKAGAIFYRMLNTYLLPTAQFEDAWRAAIRSAEDLYGPCSAEAIATNNAWYAVGFGDPITDDDFTVLEVQSLGNCGLGETEQFSIAIKFNGCNSIPAGTSFQVALFQQIPFNSFIETHTLASDLNGGEVFSHTFSNAVDLSGLQDNKLFARVIYPNDPISDNNLSPTLEVKQVYSIAEQLIDFEQASWVDSVLLLSGDRSTTVVDSTFGNGNGYGIMMEGSGSVNYRLVNAFPLWGGPVVDVFDFNPDYRNQACICVDATAMQTLDLSFDRRQIFSTHLASELDNQFPNPSDSLISSQVNTLRLLINEQEIARYNAITPDSDAWTTHIFNLDSLAGSQFHVCFEGKTIFSKAFDPQARGDRIFLDNISIQGIFTGIQTALETLPLVVFPNPSQGTLYFEAQFEQAEDLKAQLFDVQGKLVWQQNFQLAAGAKRWQTNLGDLPQGLYLLDIQGENGSYQEKLVIE
ncbi:MAG: M4 family metallopeptidase [Bacteroidota bacterium]